MAAPLVLAPCDTPGDESLYHYFTGGVLTDLAPYVNTGTILKITIPSIYNHSQGDLIGCWIVIPVPGETFPTPVSVPQGGLGILQLRPSCEDCINSLCCITPYTLISWNPKVYNVLPDGCCECLPHPAPAPEPPPARVYPLPVKRFYLNEEPQCDVDNTINFGNVFYDVCNQLKQGITSYYKPLEILNTWMRKRLTDLSGMHDSAFPCKSEVPHLPFCKPEIPIACNILADPFGRTTFIAISGEYIQAYKVVIIRSDGKVYINNPADISTYQRVVGFAAYSVASGLPVTVIASGNLTVPGWGLAKGSIYYTTSLGSISTIVPTSGISQQIGIALDSDTLSIDIKQAIIL